MYPDLIISNQTSLDDTDVQKCIAALQRQVDYDFAPIWSTSSVLHYGSKNLLTPDEWGITLDERTSGEYLGEHHLDNVPRGVVLLGACKANNEDWRTTLSHETLELLGDALANLSVELPDGSEEAYESCDAVEGDAYLIDEQPMSNFVIPLGYFSEQGEKYDYLKKLSAPHTMTSGGYRLVRQPGQQWGQDNGQLVRGYKAQPHRWSRRGRRMHRSKVR